MFQKRHVSLKRLSAKQTRPVQHVAPRPESSPKPLTAKNTHRPAGGQQCECKLIQLTGVLLAFVSLLEFTYIVIFCLILFVCFLPALARRASDNSNSGKHPTDVDPNKKKSTRKGKAGIKVEYSQVSRFTGSKVLAQDLHRGMNQLQIINRMEMDL